MRNIIPIFVCFLKVLKHKWFVAIAGRKLKVSWYRIIIHDLSKMGWAELPHYARNFHGDKSQPEAFAKAWLHHQNVNPHHWEYWVSRSGHHGAQESAPLPMPEHFVREMFADWQAASKGYGGAWPTPENWPWLRKNYKYVYERMHPETQKIIVKLMDTWVEECKAKS